MKKSIENINPLKICGRMKQTRVDLGFKSAKAFSKEIGIKYTTYTNYEKDRLPPSEFLFALKSKYPYDVNIDWILNGIEPNGNTERQIGPVNTELLQGVIKGVEDYLKKGKLQLDPEHKARLVAILYDRFEVADQDVNPRIVSDYLKLVA